MRHAVRIHEDFFAARELLSRGGARAAPRLDRAIEHAEKGDPLAGCQAPTRGCSSPPRTPEAASQPRRRAARSVRARAAGLVYDRGEGAAREITIQLNGARAGAHERLPAGSTATLRAALAALRSKRPAPGDAASVAREGQDHLALGSRSGDRDADRRSRGSPG